MTPAKLTFSGQNFTALLPPNLLFEAKSYSLATKLTLSRKNLQSVRGGEVIYRSGGETKILLGGEKVGFTPAAKRPPG